MIQYIDKRFRIFHPNIGTIKSYIKIKNKKKNKSTNVLILSFNFRYMRKIRPDGNCFYRAFGFTTLEHLIKNKEEFKKFRQVIEESKVSL